MRARIYHVECRDGEWYAFGIPMGRPRLRCTWAITEQEAVRLQGDLARRPVEHELGDPIRTIGVTQHFAPTEGY